MAFFDVYKNGQRQNAVEYNGAEMIIGREPMSEIRLFDPHASRRHARIRPDKGVIVVEDLGTGNGTFVNGRREYRRKLCNGDKIQIGSYVLVWYQQPDEQFSDDAEDPLARTVVDAGLLAKAHVVQGEVVQGTSVVGPGVMARMRAEADIKMGPHLLEERETVSVPHPLKFGVNIVGGGDQCQIRIESIKRPKAASFEKQADGSFLVKKLGFFAKLSVNGKRCRKAVISEESRLEIEGVTIFFRPGKRTQQATGQQQQQQQQRA